MQNPRAIIAAVKPCGRAAAPFLHRGALAVSLVAVPQTLPPPSFQDLLIDLSSAIVATLEPDEQVQVVAAKSGNAGDLARLLAQRGVQVVDRGRTIVSFTCEHTLLERLCLADVRKGDASELVSVRRAHQGLAASVPVTPMVLEVRPLLAQPTPILDVAVVGRHLFVLDPSSVTRYERTQETWRLLDSRPIAAPRPWPRDVRGRLIVEPTTFDVYLPGVGCRGTMDPFDLRCTEERRSWPLGIENRGLEPARNYFTMSDGRRYYAIAALGPDAGAPWLAAMQDGRLLFLDDARRAIESAIGSGDEVAAIVASCIVGSHVLLPARAASPGEGDTLRLFRVAAGQLAAVTPPIVLSGSLTAMWAAGASGATVVSHNTVTGRYEAFQVGVACGR